MHILRSLFICFFLLTGCQQTTQLTLEKVEWKDLPAFRQDPLTPLVPAIQRSCAVISPNNVMSRFCNDFKRLQPSRESELRALLIQHFDPYKMLLGANEKGKITGYYEPELKGSLIKKGTYQTPLYKYPPSYINAHYSRHAIAQGALDHKGLELVYVSDPIDAFFLEIQGSGRVILENGEIIKVGYGGQNGFPYTAIGKILVAEGELTVAQATMQGIKQWMRTHPEKAQDLMFKNESYVFFKELSNKGPIGSQGVILTPGRSLAIDPNFIPLGTLLWIDALHPDAHKAPIQQLMIAQDTGGAIKGALRADYFWGPGKQAEDYAGRMNSPATFYILRPKE